MKAYLRSFVTAFSLLTLASAVFVALIDPYDYWNSPRVGQLNKFKPDARRHYEIIKQRQYDRIRPSTIVAGNSRVEVGFDPASQAWPAPMKPVYNFGFPGQGLPNVVEAVLLAADRHKPERIYLGLDVFDFLIKEEAWHDPATKLAIRRTPQSLMETAADLGRINLSLDAFVDSWATIIEQRKTHPVHTTPSGFNPLFEYQDAVATEGHAILFEQSNIESAKRHKSRGKAVRWPMPGRNPNFDALDLIAKETRDRGIELVLFTYPYHREPLRVADEAGLSPAIADWRRLLAQWSVNSDIPIWDFNRLNSVTTEPVPARGDTHTHMRWYWEGEHFKPRLGNYMIQIMTGQRQPDDFGNRL